jgi:simple sugar transport system substrate-binding protein
VYYIDEIRKLLDGSWTGGRQVRWGIKEGVVELTPLNPTVPADVAKVFESRKQAIMSGALTPFAGPIKDNGGALKVANGTALTVDELNALNWYVDGVDGTVPK